MADANGRVLIAGAGIGGLTAAVALSRAGHEVLVLERMPELAELGAGLSLAMNAMAALREIGLYDEVVAVGNPIHEFRHRTADGSVMRSWPMDVLEQRLGEVGHSMARPALQRVLRGAAAAAEIRTGCAVIGVDQDAAGVTARLADGSTERGAALIVADGLQSTLRPQFDPTPLRYAGFTAWRGLASPGSDLGEPLDRQTQTYGEGSVFGTIPLGGGQFYWYATLNAPAGGRDDPGTVKQSLLDRFGRWHDPIPDLLQSTDGGRISRSDVYDLPERPRWGTGRVTLLGDAAHPTTPTLGQGACLSIEDAAILARHLATGSSDPAPALRAYEAERIPRTAWVVAQSGARAKMVQVDGAFAMWRRDTFMRRLPMAPVNARLAKVFGFPARAPLPQL